MKTLFLLTYSLTHLLTHTHCAHGEIFTVTACCPCKKCCGPQAAGITASGRPARAGITVAGPRALPFGTRVRIPGVGERVVQDRLAKRFDSRIDIFFATHAESKRFGIKSLDVTLLK